MTTIRIASDDDDVMTIKLPGLTAVRIDTSRRVIAIDWISGTADCESPEWTLRDLRDGTFGDFHRLRPADECGHVGCAGSEHDTMTREG